MPTNNKRGDRGSALLIVFLMAAVLAISLYMEMPTIAFEAKRAKEQLLIDRGNEYAHAVKLYYRRFRTYPASIDALENTNRIRFLRHKFKDPITGDDKWRLLHAGAGGQLIDSKVNPIRPNGNGQTSASGSNSNTGTSTPAFANSFVAATDAGGPPTVAALPQRPPEMPINGGGAAPPTANADPTQSLLAPSGVTPVPVQPGATPGTQTAAPGSLPPSQALQPFQQTQPVNGAPVSNPMQGVQGLFSNPNPPAGAGAPATTAPITNSAAPAGGTTAFNTATTTATSSGMGVVQSGGLAGVASLAKGTSIKTVNDQTDYSLWEFYYDPTKDTSLVGNSGMNGANGAAQQTGTSPTGFAPANPSSTSTPPPATTPPPPAPAPPPQQP